MELFYSSMIMLWYKSVSNIYLIVSHCQSVSIHESIYLSIYVYSDLPIHPMKLCYDNIIM